MSSKFIQLILIVLTSISYAATADSEPSSVVTAKPRFEQRGQFVYLIVSNADHNFGISWSMPPDLPFVPLSLDTNRFYTFTVEEKPFRGITTIPELRIVQLNGQTVYDVRMCELHKSKMEQKEVDIVYGLFRPAPDAPTADIERRLFPHRREYSLGGCAIRPDSPKTEKVYVCGACKDAFAWWSGTATAPYSVLPRDTRYDQDQHLHLVYLEFYSKGYVAAWARKEALPVFGPTSEDDKARVFGYTDGMAAGRIARDAWSGANGQRYGPTNSALPKR